MIYHKLLLPFFLSFLLCLFPFHEAIATPDTPKIYAEKITHIKNGKRNQGLRVHSVMILETQEILANIHHLAGLSSHQLPNEYYHFYFPIPVTLSPFSPVRHPIHEMIITIPQHRWEHPHLLIQNKDRQWLEYKSTHSLSILIKQIQAWNP